MQILQVIKRHGYRLEDVANALGITKGSLSATINGSPNVKKLIEIALVIGCSPAEFFDDWYDNEGKEQERPAAQQPSAQGGQEKEAQGDGLPFSSGQPIPADAPTRSFSALAHQSSGQPSVQMQQAIICPHCKKAMTITVQA